MVCRVRDLDEREHQEAGLRLPAFLREEEGWGFRQGLPSVRALLPAEGESVRLSALPRMAWARRVKLGSGLGMHREEKGPMGFAKMVRDLESAKGHLQTERELDHLESAKGHPQTERELVHLEWEAGHLQPEREPVHLESEADHLEPERELGLRPEGGHLGWEERQRHPQV